MAGAFQTPSFWLLLDDSVNVLNWDRGPGTEEWFHRWLVDSGRLPDLAGAPVASWLVARLARLIGGLPAWACNQQGDEGDFRLGFLLFDRQRARIGCVEFLAGRRGVGVCCEAPDAGRVLKELTDALLAAPADVAECRVEVREAEDEAECALQGLDPDTRCQGVYGYEWSAYLGGPAGRREG